MWPPERAAEAGYEADHSCQRCGHHHADEFHICWECEAIDITAWEVSQSQQHLTEARCKRDTQAALY
eukprot:12405770-Karenia_brevis.AAC.1